MFRLHVDPDLGKASEPQFLEERLSDGPPLS